MRRQYEAIVDLKSTFEIDTSNNEDSAGRRRWKRHIGKLKYNDQLIRDARRSTKHLLISEVGSSLSV